MEFGFLLGDVVRDTTASSWDAVMEDINLINIPVFVASGNHDNSQEYLTRFGSYYYYFINYNDLFIVLSPSLTKWNIIDDQKEFLINTLNNFSDQVNNIFVIQHELTWWSPNNIFNNIVINYLPIYPGHTNFWTEVEPIFNNLQNNVVFFAGDLGATTQITPYMYYNYDNITLIGTGMGGGIKDNFIISDVYNDTIIFKLYALNYDDPTALGELSDYSLYTGIHEEKTLIDIDIYPNPVKDKAFVKNEFSLELSIQVFDYTGKLLLFLNTDKNKITLNFNNWTKGIYIVKVLSDSKIKTFRILKN